ncbi:hypothetical protein Tco_1464266 [Tanacetum coccineum]
MVNTSLKKLKHHLASFDKVIKERTTATAIIEGTWGFEHTKACFRDEIIPFVKELKDIFNKFDQDLTDELTEVQTIFIQMEQVIEQHRLELKTFEVKMNQVLNENDRLLEQVINKDIVNIVMNSTVDNASVNMHECNKCLKLETELLNKKDFVEKEIYDKLFKNYTNLKKHCISLEFDTELNQEIFQRDNSISNQSAPNFDLCNGCMLSDNYDLYVLNVINDVNARAKSKSTFTIVGNVCPLTRITTSTEVPHRKPIALESETSKPVVTLVYSRKPRKSKTTDPFSKPKIIKSANNKESSKS